MRVLAQHGDHRARSGTPHTNFIVLTLDTSHAAMGWLNTSAVWNIWNVDVTLATSHFEISSLKPGANDDFWKAAKRLAMLVTLEVSQSVTCP